jgi:ABC-2 type transport system ATP-binding protein
LSSGPAIAASDLRVDRGGREVLKGLSFEIPRGLVTGLLGPSGCGKTTLMRSIVGTQIVRAGVVTVLGAPAGSAELRPRIGYMTQAPSVYGDLTARENLDYFARVLDAAADHVRGVVETIGLSEHAGQRVDSLSGGQRARVSLGTALLGSPEVLVLDEPTVGLDPLLRNELWQHFHALADAGVSLLVSSHIMEEAARCDRLLLMREGAILAITTPDELRRRTGSDDLEQAFTRLIEEQVNGRET